MLAEFFSRPTDEKLKYVAPGSHGQTGYTGLLVETAASSDVPDWKEMLNWGREAPDGHPLRTRFPHRYGPQVLPEGAVPGISDVLNQFHERIADLQRRFLRIIAVAVGCHEEFFDAMLRHGPHLTRAIHYPAMDLAPDQGHVWAGAHGDINLITALPRASAPGLQVQTDGGWVDAVAPEGQVIINTGMMLEQLTNGVIPTGIHRVVAAPGQGGERYSVVQFCHPTPWTVLSPVRPASRRSGPSATAPSRPATAWTRCSGRSTWSRTAAGSTDGRRGPTHHLSRARISSTTSVPVSGWRKTSRPSVSPFQRVGVTKATPSSRSSRDQRYQSASVQPWRRNRTTDSVGSITSSTGGPSERTRSAVQRARSSPTSTARR